MRGSFIHSSLDDLGLNPFEFRVLAHILRRGRHTDSVPTAARHCHMAESTYREALKTLESAGLIRSEERPGKSTVYEANPIPETSRGAGSQEGPVSDVTWVEDEPVSDSTRVPLAEVTRVSAAPVPDVEGVPPIPLSDVTGPRVRSDRGPVSDLTDEGLSFEGTPFKGRSKPSPSAEHSVGIGPPPTAAEVWEDIQNETTLDTLNRIAPAVRLIFEDLARLKRLPYQVRLTQAKALIERVNQHGAEAVEEALSYTLARIGDLTSPFSYALARLERTQPAPALPGTETKDDREWTGADLLDLDVPLEGSWGRN